jgi:hypothetical protein
MYSSVPIASMFNLNSFKDCTRVKMQVKAKHASLFPLIVTYVHKKFIEFLLDLGYQQFPFIFA